MAFEQAFETVRSYFDLLPEQKESIKSFFSNKKRVHKSSHRLWNFQCLPLVYDLIHQKERGSSVLLSSHLSSHSVDQRVTKLNNLGIPTVSLVGTDDPEIITQVSEGYYPLIYCSPEILLSSYGRDILSDATFRSKLIGVAIDEAHCISH